MGEARKVAGLANDLSKEQNRRHLGSTKRANNSSFCCVGRHQPSQKCEVRTDVSKIQITGFASR